jgi:glutamate synthase domain-containing protein 3
MAGGVILVLGLNLSESERCKARFVGTGMHGGVIYVRDDILELGEGTKTMAVGKRDSRVIESLVREFCGYFGFDFEKVMSTKFRKIVPVSRSHMKRCARTKLPLHAGLEKGYFIKRLATNRSFGNALFVVL